MAAQGRAGHLRPLRSGGPHGATERAATAAIQDESGEAESTPSAIDGINQIAKGAHGDENKDLLTLGTAVNDAANKGSGYNGWSDAMNAFYIRSERQVELRRSRAD